MYFFFDLLLISVQNVNYLQNTLHEHLDIFSTDSPMPKILPQRSWQESRLKCYHSLLDNLNSVRTVSLEQKEVGLGCMVAVAALQHYVLPGTHRSVQLGVFSWYYSQVMSMSFHTWMNFCPVLCRIWSPEFEIIHHCALWCGLKIGMH